MLKINPNQNKMCGLVERCRYSFRKGFPCIREGGLNCAMAKNSVQGTMLDVLFKTAAQGNPNPWLSLPPIYDGLRAENDPRITLLAYGNSLSEYGVPISLSPTLQGTRMGEHDGTSSLARLNLMMCVDGLQIPNVTFTACHNSLRGTGMSEQKYLYRTMSTRISQISFELMSGFQRYALSSSSFPKVTPGEVHSFPNFIQRGDPRYAVDLPFNKV